MFGFGQIMVDLSKSEQFDCIDAHIWFYRCIEAPVKWVLETLHNLGTKQWLLDLIITKHKFIVKSMRTTPVTNLSAALNIPFVIFKWNVGIY